MAVFSIVTRGKPSGNNAAGTGQGFVQSDFVAQGGEFVGCGQARGAAAHHGHGFARGGEQVLHDAVARGLVVRGRALEVADFHGLAQVAFAVAAAQLARPAANAAQHPGQDVDHAVQLIRAAVAVLGDAPDIARDVGEHRAPVLAGDVLGDVAEIPHVRGESDLTHHLAAVCGGIECFVFVFEVKTFLFQGEHLLSESLAVS